MENKELENINTSVNKSQIDLAYEMTKSIDDDFIEYVYRGNFSENITLNILNLTEAKFINDKDAHKKQKRVSYLLIESLQNVIRHGDTAKDKNVNNESLLVIQKTKKSIYITTGNIIEHKNIKELNDYLISIKEASKEELNKKYNKTLLDGIITEKGGGGLGLLTMIRRAKGKFKFDFKKINDSYSYYYYQIQITIIEDNNQTENLELISLDRISKFHDLLNKENILLNFNGSFAFKNLENILPFIESHAIGGQDIKQRVFDLTVKTIKNIVKYADNFSKNVELANKNGRGVFILSNKDGKLFLTAGNLILNKKTVLLSNKINIINQTDHNSLIKIRDYLEKFYSFSETKQPDLSLINMKLKNKSNINYTFKRIDKNLSYFILQLVI